MQWTECFLRALSDFEKEPHQKAVQCKLNIKKSAYLVRFKIPDSSLSRQVLEITRSSAAKVARRLTLLGEVRMQSSTGTSTICNSCSSVCCFQISSTTGKREEQVFSQNPQTVKWCYQNNGRSTPLYLLWRERWGTCWSCLDLEKDLVASLLFWEASQPSCLLVQQQGGWESALCPAGCRY